MFVEHLGDLADDFITFYGSSARSLSIETFLTTLRLEHIVIYSEFFYTKGITFHMYSNKVDLNFTMGEYVVVSIPLDKRLTFIERWYFVIVMTLKHLNNESVKF